MSYCISLGEYELFTILTAQRQDNLSSATSMRPPRASTMQPIILLYRYIETVNLNISQIKYNNKLTFIDIHNLKFAADFVNVQIDKYFYMFGWDEGHASLVSKDNCGYHSSNSFTNTFSFTATRFEYMGIQIHFITILAEKKL